MRPPALLVMDPDARPYVFADDTWRRISEIVDLGPGPLDARAFIERTDLDDVEVLITGWGAPQITDQLLGRMPRLRAVLHAAGSIRQLVTPTVWRRGVTVVSAADANNEPVAEYVYAQIVLALKDTHRRARVMSTERRLPDFTDVPGIYRQTIGLVAFGSIARKVRDRVRALRADVLVWDPHLTETEAALNGVRLTRSLHELFATSRVVSVHAPWIPGITDDLIRLEHLEVLPPRATFVNTARGALVRETDLVELLTARPDVEAVLDVTTDEPPAADSPLYDLPNVQLTGHTAGSVGGERADLGRLVADELERLLTGLPLHHAVSEAGSRLRA
ncbi:oxidoreductase [Pseudonocardia sp. MH-G8]|nr:oxidoreductase [Pseudonocardia sp. MH-G8]